MIRFTTPLMILALGSPVFGGSTTQPSPTGFDYTGYAAVLKTRVDGQGLVDYAELKKDRAGLSAFARALAVQDPKAYGRWGEAARIAFWTNAYNGLTLMAIVDRYPIKPSSEPKAGFPANSIGQIPGVWDKLRFTVMGKPMTLNQIEHEVLRKQFNEPRIHVALVCAAHSCPPLRNEPFLPGKLTAQLDDQTRRFLARPGNFRIDRAKGQVHLSKIFEWFGSDFIKTYGTDKAPQRAVLNFVGRYVKGDDRAYLATGKYAVQYAHYDWALNEQPKRPG